MCRSADGFGSVIGGSPARRARTICHISEFPTEDASVAEALPEPHNPTNAWQGAFRVGWLDLALLQYAIDAGDRQIDALIMTCLDRMQALPYARIGVGYSLTGADWTPANDHPGDLEHQESDGMRLN